MSEEDDLEKGELTADTEGVGEDGEEEDGAAAFERTLYATIWKLAAVITIGAAVGAVGYTGAATIVIVQAAFAVISAIAVFYFQSRLQNTETLRTVMNQIRKDVNELAEANTVLSHNNDRLEEALEPLKKTQKKLAKIAKKNGATVNKLQELVRENARCMYETHIVLRTDIKQTLMGVVFDADQNEDGVFSDKELRRLKTRFKNVPAVKLNEKIFDKKLKRNRRVNAVLDLVCTVHDRTIPDKKKAIVVDEAAYVIPDDDSY